MKKTVYFAIILFALLSCKTASKQESVREKQKTLYEAYEQATTREEKEKWLYEIYNNKDYIPDEEKEYFIEFLEKASKETETGKKLLKDLYNAPGYSRWKPGILKALAEHIEDPEIYEFVRKELNKNPDYYTHALRETLLAKKHPHASAILMERITGKSEELSPEVLEHFGETKYTESIPLIAESIEKDIYPEAGIQALREMAKENEFARETIKSIARTPNPNQIQAIDVLPEVVSPQEAYAIYLEILKDPTQTKEAKGKTLEKLKEILPYLSVTQKKELKEELEELSRNPYFKENKNFTLTVERGDFSGTYFSLPRDPVLSAVPKKEKTGLVSKKDKTRTIEEKPEIDRNKEAVKFLTASKTYMPFVVKKLSQMTRDNPEDIKKTVTNIHNALLTYAKTDSDNARFIKEAYKKAFPKIQEEDIPSHLSKGLYLKNSLYHILSYLENQYERKDHQVFALQRLFAIKRKHAEALAGNAVKFQEK